MARAAVDEVRVGAHGDADLRGQAFIDLPVAIVVHHVANFGGGIDVADAREVLPDALNRAESTGHRVADAAARAHAADVVDGAVAVVIDHVAAFGRR